MHCLGTQTWIQILTIPSIHSLIDFSESQLLIKWNYLHPSQRAAMTNLDSVLKGRDITLPTKVCIVKAMVFLVVMYRCESCWTIKKAEH